MVVVQAQEQLVDFVVVKHRQRAVKVFREQLRWCGCECGGLAPGTTQA